MRQSLESYVLRGMYFTYLGGAGIAITYWPYHFEALGLTKTQIGVIFGVRMAMAVVSQPLLTRFADRWGRPALMLVVSLTITFLLSAGMLVADEFLPVALVMWLSAPFAAVFVPLTDATTIRRLGVKRYGSIRLWGSVGFGLSVAIFGFFVRDMTHAESGLVAVPVFLGFAALCALLCGMLQRSEPAHNQSKKAPRFSPGWAFVPFVTANAIHWSCVTVYNVYFALHTEALGMTPFVPGACIAVGIAGEVVAFAVAERTFRGSELRWMVVMCVVSGLRWIVVATSESVGVMVAIQALHFFTFGVWFSLAIRLLGRFAPLERRATVQGVFSAACFGVGGAFGSFAGGVLMEHRGGGVLFLAAAVAELVALAVFIVALRAPNRGTVNAG